MSLNALHMQPGADCAAASGFKPIRWSRLGWHYCLLAAATGTHHTALTSKKDFVTRNCDCIPTSGNPDKCAFAPDKYVFKFLPDFAGRQLAAALGCPMLRTTLRACLAFFINTSMFLRIKLPGRALGNRYAARCFDAKPRPE